MAEGEKAFAEAKSTFDNPLAEPESAPQIAAEPQPAVADARRRLRSPASRCPSRHRSPNVAGCTEEKPPRPRPPADLLASEQRGRQARIHVMIMLRGLEARGSDGRRQLAL